MIIDDHLFDDDDVRCRSEAVDSDRCSAANCDCHHYPVLCHMNRASRYNTTTLPDLVSSLCVLTVIQHC